MRKFITYESIQNENNFWLWFLAVHFPDSWNEQTDPISEILWDNYEIDEEWCKQFTGYYDGILDENDGYSNEPTTLQLELSNDKFFIIEFHPGETVFYLGEEELGCIGPHTKIHKITWQDFTVYTKLLDSRKKLLLMPILVITSKEQGELEQWISNGLLMLEVIKVEDYERIRKGIVNHCFAE